MRLQAYFILGILDKYKQIKNDANGEWNSSTAQ